MRCESSSTCARPTTPLTVRLLHHFRNHKNVGGPRCVRRAHARRLRASTTWTSSTRSTLTRCEPFPAARAPLTALRYLYEELMEADLHAIVCCACLSSLANILRSDSVGTAAVGRSLPVLHLPDALRAQGARIWRAGRRIAGLTRFSTSTQPACCIAISSLGICSSVSLAGLSPQLTGSTGERRL